VFVATILSGRPANFYQGQLTFSEADPTRHIDLKLTLHAEGKMANLLQIVKIQIYAISAWIVMPKLRKPMKTDTLSRKQFIFIYLEIK